MAADELRLITTIISTGNLQLPMNEGITPEKLSGSPEASAVYAAILKYADTHDGKTPGWSWTKRQYPKVDFPLDCDDDLGDLVKAILKEYKAKAVTAIFEKTAELSNGDDGDIDDAIGMATMELEKLMATGSRSADVMLDPEMPRILRDLYKRNLETKGRTGAEWPWAPLNEFTPGIEERKFYIIYGLMKSMKTWLSLAIVDHYAATTKERVLLYVREMSIEDIMVRLALIRTKVNSFRFDKGVMTAGEQTRFFREMDRLELAFKGKEGRSQYIFMGIKDGGHASVRDVRARVKKYGPGLVYTDSMYLMENDRDGKKKSRSADWKNVSDISGDLADLAHDLGPAVFATTQDNDRFGRQFGRYGTASIGFGSKQLMDCDGAFQVYKFYDENKKSDIYPKGEPEIAVFPKAVRKMETPEFTIRGVPAESFEFKHWGAKDPTLYEDKEERKKKGGSSRDIMQRFEQGVKSGDSKPPENKGLNILVAMDGSAGDS